MRAMFKALISRFTFPSEQIRDSIELRQLRDEINKTYKLACSAFMRRDQVEHERLCTLHLALVRKWEMLADAYEQAYFPNDPA